MDYYSDPLQRRGRRLLRVQTAPTPNSPGTTSHTWAEFRPPDTLEVRKQLSQGGPTTTPLEVALSIVARLLEVPGNDPEELLFVRECLKASRSKTTVPFVLSSHEAGVHHDSMVQDFLLRTYSKTALIPTLSFSPVSQGLASTASSVSFRALEEREGAHLPRPVEFGDVLPDHEEDVGAEVQEMVDTCFDDWGFDTFRFSRLTEGQPLVFVGWEAFRRNSLLSDPTLPIESRTARTFLQSVEAAYKKEDSTPYHNNLHAADVTQSVHALLGTLGFEAYFDRLSVLSLVLGAVVHDMGHDGRNNAFHITVRDDLALTYNDHSVQENFHVASAFKLIFRNTSTNILVHFPEEQQARIRKEMITCVLGTDMAHHFSNMGNIKSLIKNLGNDPDDWHSEQTALADLQAFILHVADISNPAKPPELSKRWVDRLTQEFFAQGDEEKELNIPVSPFCDRVSSKTSSSQVGFIRFIVEPAFQALTELEHMVAKVCLTEVSANITYWEAQKAADAMEVAQEGADDETASEDPRDALDKRTAPEKLQKVTEKVTVPEEDAQVAESRTLFVNFPPRELSRQEAEDGVDEDIVDRWECGD
mmetsp:Transcript_108840/g.306715  ORF Transcript_108840/g.306715 Transcript_108840/m.306715 type:complete len:589 (+) Transcript_108840:186-1952(+)